MGTYRLKRAVHAFFGWGWILLPGYLALPLLATDPRLTELGIIGVAARIYGLAFAAGGLTEAAIELLGVNPDGLARRLLVAAGFAGHVSWPPLVLLLHGLVAPGDGRAVVIAIVLVALAYYAFALGAFLLAFSIVGQRNSHSNLEIFLSCTYLAGLSVALSAGTSFIALFIPTVVLAVCSPLVIAWLFAAAWGLNRVGREAPP